MAWITDKLSNVLIRFLSGKIKEYEPFSITSGEILRETLQPCDVLLVEGNQRFSVAVKYLTQSTWSHAAMYVGDISEALNIKNKCHMLIEADINKGVHALPLSFYESFNTRICRPVGLYEKDRQHIIDYMIDSIGMGYDFKNVVDLARYLIPTPPVPTRWRRRMLSLGSGDPTRVICSTQIAKAFQSVKYPILPHIEVTTDHSSASRYTMEEILHIRHHSLFTPCDFDLSPYFKIIKPTIEKDFDYKQLSWNE